VFGLFQALHPWGSAGRSGWLSRIKVAIMRGVIVSPIFGARCGSGVFITRPLVIAAVKTRTASNRGVPVVRLPGDLTAASDDG